MVAEPTPCPVTVAVSPEPNTSATAALRVVHVTAGFGTGLPLLSPTAANRVILPPIPTVVGPEIRRYAPPPPAWARSTERVVVSPATTWTEGVMEGARNG